MTNRLLGALAIIAIIIVAGYLVRILWLSDDPPPMVVAPVDAALAPDAQPLDRPIVVVAMRGRAERRGPDGAWSELAVGQHLAADDMIRTSDDGHLSLRLGKLAVVDVDPASQISVPALATTVTKVRLAEGRIEARVPGGSDRRFGVEVPGVGGEIETGAGEFSVLTDGKGEATVAARKGRVKLTAQKTSVDVEEGQQASIRAGSAPSAPRVIASSLFLRVKKPRGLQRVRSLTLRGSTTPGAVIRINGVRVAVDADGGFATVVPLEEGKNTIKVESNDVLGRTKESTANVRVDSRGPTVGGAVKWGGNK